MILPLLWEDLQDSAKKQRQTPFSWKKRELPVLLGVFWRKLVLVSSRYSVSGDAQPWGHHVSQCLLPSSCTQDRGGAEHPLGHTATGSSTFLSEELSLTTLNYWHDGNSSSSLSLSHSRQKGSNENTYKAALDIWLFCLPLWLCDRAQTVKRSCHGKVYRAHGLKAWLSLL